jgi:hypothetical protein
MTRLTFKVGDWVEVRSLEEILNTLDADGCLDGMPFMPEMEQFCGRRFKVYKSAHKGCDTVFPVRSRLVDDAVHLSTRCDGQAHDGCQAGCLLYWKTAWLKPADMTGGSPDAEHHGAARTREAPKPRDARIDMSRLREATIARYDQGTPIYRCQNTQFPYASRGLAPWDVRQYLLDYQSGNVGLWQILCGAAYSAFDNLSNLGIGIGRPMRWFYNTFHWVWRGVKFPRTAGSVPVGQSTPTVHLNLQPGEIVRVKSHEEILKTISVNGKNRGLSWDADQVPYCGGTYKVLRRVTRIIEEKNGRMVTMKHPCIILDDVVCKARYTRCRMFCPREIYPYWREIWLERVEGSAQPVSAGQSSTQKIPP